MQLKYQAWQMGATKQDDNVRQSEITEDTDFISMPEEQFDDSIMSDKSKLESLRVVLIEHFKFDGNLVLSASGKSFNLYRGKLEDNSNAVEIDDKLADRLGLVVVPF